MTTTDPAAPAAPPAAVRAVPDRPAGAAPLRRPVGLSVEGVALVLLACVALRPLAAPHLGSRAFGNATTIFVAICVQALPFLTLGVVLSGLLAAFVTPTLMARLLPARPLLAVPAAGLAGAALPGCECGSIPIAGRLIGQGAAPAAALAFLLSAPAINPVVLVATAVAFPHRPGMVLARLSASLATAVLTGLVWQRIGGPSWLRPQPRERHEADTGRFAIVTGTALHDLLHAGGFLVVGAATAATLQTVVPRSVLGSLAGNAVVAVVTMAILAFVLAICSQADAFVAAGLTQFSLSARLVFLVVGPAVDVKLVALQAGTFGRRFAVRFAPLTLLVAVACALAAGAVFL